MNCKDDCKNYEGCEYAPECECVLCCVEFVPKEAENATQNA